MQQGPVCVVQSSFQTDISVRSTVRFWGFIEVEDWLAQISRNGNFSLPATRSLLDDQWAKIKQSPENVNQRNAIVILVQLPWKRLVL